jgi:hypothetical protein
MQTILRVNGSYDNIGPSPVLKTPVPLPKLTPTNSNMTTPLSLQTYDYYREDTQRATTKRYLARRHRRRP